ncbi:3-deoxy-D-manno-octulosonate 8-phosphate phosphatase KdsC [Halomonadaceae bacterium LMG 33818]|uniref:KdsC family phosphatase n=1 Tax=Cernens ardua TaxID=3402176 RepID=UPI003EDB808D
MPSFAHTTPTLNERMQGIRLLALDVDGVLTDGAISYAASLPPHDTSSTGTGNETLMRELKSFNVQDGLGIRLLQQYGIEVAIITGRRSPMVEQRARELGITRLFQGRNDKLAALNELAEECSLPLVKIAYCGDDLPDLGAIQAAGLGASVANAPDYIRVHANIVTEKRGGEGAVRELADLILQAQGHWDSVLAQFITQAKPNCAAG